MGKDAVELIFVIDKSGSMSGLEGDTIGGFNSMLEKQKKEDGTAMVTTFTFNDHVDMVHDRIDIDAVRPMSKEDYLVGGGTALFDAMGMAMHKEKKVYYSVDENYRPGKVIFVIITDGVENSSRHYTQDMIRERVEKYTDIGWKFIFFGTDMEVINQGYDMGISREYSYTFTSDGDGIRGAFDHISEISSMSRKGMRK